MPADVAIGEISGDDLLARFDEFLAVYLEVYAEPPYHAGPLWHADAFATRTRAQASRAGFDCVTARDNEDALIGFTFGLPFDAGSWWSGNATPPSAEILAATKFAIIELVLRKPWRGQGIGHRLHDALLARRSEEYAILTAVPIAPARKFYTHWGWTKVGTAHHTPDSPILDALAIRLH